MWCPYKVHDKLYFESVLVIETKSVWLQGAFDRHQHSLNLAGYNEKHVK